ncbi:MAG: SecDF P1 head subdomain-containing protein [Sphingomonadaceae bacterium]
MLRALIAVPIALLLIAASAPRQFTIAGKRFKETDIVDARALPDLNGTAAVLLTLDDKAARRLARISKRNAQKQIDVALDGKTLVRPVMNSIISDGVLQLSGLFSFEEATILAKRISGKDPLPESLEEAP